MQNDYYSGALKRFLLDRGPMILQPSLQAAPSVLELEAQLSFSIPRGTQESSVLLLRRSKSRRTDPSSPSRRLSLVLPNYEARLDRFQDSTSETPSLSSTPDTPV